MKLYYFIFECLFNFVGNITKWRWLEYILPFGKMVHTSAPMMLRSTILRRWQCRNAVAPSCTVTFVMVLFFPRAIFIPLPFVSNVEYQSLRHSGYEYCWCSLFPATKYYVHVVFTAWINKNSCYAGCNATISYYVMENIKCYLQLKYIKFFCYFLFFVFVTECILTY